MGQIQPFFFFAVEPGYQSQNRKGSQHFPVVSAQFDTTLTPDFYWMIGLEYLFDNQPAKGKEDLSLNTGITIRTETQDHICDPPNPPQLKSTQLIIGFLT